METKDLSAGQSASDEAPLYPTKARPEVITVCMNEIPGYRIVKVIGLVSGLTVRSRNWGTDVGAFFRSAVGGELKWLTSLAYKSRDAAIDRMVDDCIARGGNAILTARLDVTEIGMYIQTTAYGTACVVKEIDVPEGKQSLGG